MLLFGDDDDCSGMVDEGWTMTVRVSDDVCDCLGGDLGTMSEMAAA